MKLFTVLAMKLFTVLAMQLFTVLAMKLFTVLAMKLLCTLFTEYWFLDWKYDMTFNTLHKSNRKYCRKLFHILIENDVLCRREIQEYLRQTLIR